jgi:small subunit ribosomal protein S6
MEMDQRINSYEAMFLLDAGNTDFEAASEPVRSILTRYEAQILSFKPWDDRKLAYEIRGRKRGLYVLAHFKSDPLKIVEIEHDCELDERVLRQLILRRDKLTQEQIDAPTPALNAQRVAAEAASAAATSAAGAAAAAGSAVAPEAAAAAVPEAVELPPSIEAVELPPSIDDDAIDAVPDVEEEKA